VRSTALGCACFLVALQPSIVSADAATQVETNGQLLVLCRTDAQACREQAEQQARATALALKVLEIQTVQCIVDFPENISAETLADVGLFYIRYNGIGEEEDLGYSFMRAFTEEYPCRKE
jgi:hypothetical protein